MWKYFKIQPFEDLLASAKLYLCQVSRFTDEAEARMNRFQLAAMEERTQNNPDLALSLRCFHEAIRQRSWVSCFSVADFEDKYMWKTFCPNSEGVAIKTTFRKLKAALNNTGRMEPDLSVAVVRYEETAYRPSKIGYLLFQKLPCFAEEKELRLCICRPEEEFDAAQCGKESIRVPILLRPLLGEIRVHPSASDSFFNDVRRLVSRHLPDRQSRVKWSVFRK